MNFGTRKKYYLVVNFMFRNKSSQYAVKRLFSKKFAHSKTLISTFFCYFSTIFKNLNFDYQPYIDCPTL